MALLAWTAVSSYTGRSLTCSVSASLLKQRRVVFAYHAELADGNVTTERSYQATCRREVSLASFPLFFPSHNVVDRWI